MEADDNSGDSGQPHQLNEAPIILIVLTVHVLIMVFTVIIHIAKT